MRAPPLTPPSPRKRGEGVREPCLQPVTSALAFATVILKTCRAIRSKSDSEPSMDTAQILGEFGQMQRLPVEAIRAAGADRAALAPIFVETIERYLSEGGDSSVHNALFFFF